MFGQAHVDQAVLVHVLLGEHLGKAFVLDAAAALLDLLQDVERQGTVDHGRYGDGEAVARQQPDHHQLQLLETAQRPEVAQGEHQRAGDQCGDDAVGNGRVKHHVDGQEADVQQIDHDQQRQKQHRGDECAQDFHFLNTRSLLPR